MSISVDPGSRDRYASVVGAYLLSTVLCALFGAVYELFSHEVYSYYMIYAFAFPLLLGAAPFFILLKAGMPFHESAADLIHSGVAALTAGSILKGILAIYGTSNTLIAVHWIVGAALVSAGWTAMFLSAGSVRADSPLT